MTTRLNIEDFTALEDFLRRRGHLKAADQVKFRNLPGGVSNRTVQITWPNQRGWVLKQALAKLRVDEDWFSNPERIHTEAEALRWLNCLCPKGTTPSFLFEDSENYLMAMEAVPPGHRNWKSLLLAGEIVPDDFRKFGVLLATIHHHSYERRAEVRRLFRSTEYFRTLRLDPYYAHTSENVPAAKRFLEALIEETMRHRHALVHGDFSPKNTLIYEGRLIILDYEVVHFGDPAFDVGFALTHFISKAHHLEQHRAQICAGARLFWTSYHSIVSELPWCSTLESRVVRHALGCLLARVAGKSRLEYLTRDASLRQAAVVSSLIANAPFRVDDLIDQFVDQLDTYGETFVAL